MKTADSYLMAGVLLVACVLTVSTPELRVAEAATPESTSAVVQARPSYIGVWSNGRGEALQIDDGRIRVGRNEPVAFRDVTRFSDGRQFALEITDPGWVDFFGRSKFILLTLNRNELRITLYDSYQNLTDARNSRGESNWLRDNGARPPSPGQTDAGYLGYWSNGAGEKIRIDDGRIMFIEEGRIRLSRNDPTEFRDITRVRNGREFALQITTTGWVNFFSNSKFVWLSLDRRQLRMTLYNSWRDVFDKTNPQGESTWFRDDAPGPGPRPSDREQSYLGDWSNGRGDRIRIDEGRIRFARNEAVDFRDVTRVTDNSQFALQITTTGSTNFFSNSKFVWLAIDRRQMRMTLYNSWRDMFDGKNAQGESTWFRDEVAGPGPGDAPGRPPVPAEQPYLGEWSNGRGETLSFTRRRLFYGEDDAYTYQDVTRNSDGRQYAIQITTPGRVNLFSWSKFVSLAIDRRQMRITLYNSLADLLDGRNPRGEATWAREGSGSGEPAPGSGPKPYVGEWSNTRGDTIFFTKKKVFYGRDDSVRFDDISRAMDGRNYVIQIAVPGTINFFNRAKFVALVVDRRQLKMTLYNSYQDMFNRRNPQGESTWLRD
jgi:hypothetical protein